MDFFLQTEIIGSGGVAAMKHAPNMRTVKGNQNVVLRTDVGSSLEPGKNLSALRSYHPSSRAPIKNQIEIVIN